MKHPKTIAVLGAECSGKSTFAAALAERLVCPWVPEFARHWVELQRAQKNFGGVQFSDVHAIYQGQRDWMQQAIQRASGAWVVFDTTILQSFLYSEFYFGKSPCELQKAAADERCDFYFVMDPSIPWTEDPGQRSEAGSRETFHAGLVQQLDRTSKTYHLLRGTVPERLNQALRHLQLR